MQLCSKVECYRIIPKHTSFHLLIFHPILLSLLCSKFLFCCKRICFFFFFFCNLYLFFYVLLVLHNYEFVLTLVLRQLNYYEVNFVVIVALNSDWLIWRISLYVSLSSHRYETLNGNLVYVSVMDPGIESWHLL